LLSLQPESHPLTQAVTNLDPVVFLSGPEGGLSAAEESAAIACGFAPVTLGPRVLRAETAPLAALAALVTS
jgi:16S rRNA (uracil1498-N3)-methyltransferase